MSNMLHALMVSCLVEEWLCVTWIHNCCLSFDTSEKYKIFNFNFPLKKPQLKPKLKEFKLRYENVDEHFRFDGLKKNQPKSKLWNIKTQMIDPLSQQIYWIYMYKTRKKYLRNQRQPYRTHSFFFFENKAHFLNGEKK